MISLCDAISPLKIAIIDENLNVQVGVGELSEERRVRVQEVLTNQKPALSPAADIDQSRCRLEEERLTQLTSVSRLFLSIMKNNRPKMIALTERLREPVELCDVNRDMEVTASNNGIMPSENSYKIYQADDNICTLNIILLIIQILF